MAKGNAERKMGLLPIRGCNNSNRSGDIIFVHGLGAHPITTWYPNPEEIRNEVDTDEFWSDKLPNLNFWLNWLGKYRPDLGIWSYAYEAMPFKENSALSKLPKVGEQIPTGKASPIFDQASELLELLQQRNILVRPRIFITHSLGGLIVKETLYLAHDDFNSNDKMKQIIAQTKGVIFCATPHQGSDLANFKELLAKTVKAFHLLEENVIIEQLSSDDIYRQLYKSARWYRNNSKAFEIETKAFRETEETKIPVIGKRLVVDHFSSDPQVGTTTAINGADHFRVAKPQSENDTVYIAVKEFIDDHLPKPQEKPVENPINLNPIPAPPNPNGTTLEGLATVPVWESMVKILDSNGNTVGSGFMIHSDGYFITCHHVIYNLDSIKVEYQEKEYSAVWCEELSSLEVDIAILKIDVENAKPIPISIPKDQWVSALVYGFTSELGTEFSKGFDVHETLNKNYTVNTISTYDKTINVEFTNSWNKKPQDQSTFFAYRINEGQSDGIDRGICGSLVLDEDSKCVIGVFQSSQRSKSYIISWENIIERLKLLQINPEQREAFSTVTLRNLSTSSTATSSNIYLPKPGYRTFLGREQQIETIKEVLSDTQKGKIIGVDGFGGIGKTALVQEVIKSYSDFGFDKVIWQTASTTDNSEQEQMSFETVLDAIAIQLNRPDLFKLKREEREIKTRELLQEEQVLIVLDNMETSVKPQDEIIQKLLPILGSSKALLTSRRRFTESFEDNLFPIHLRGLEQKAARALLEDIAIQKNMKKLFDSLDNRQLEQLIKVTGDEIFGYTPMALKFILGQYEKFELDFIIRTLQGVRLTDEQGQITEDDEFKQFWKYICLNSARLLSDLGKKFMLGMHNFEPNIGSNDTRIMEVTELNDSEFSQAVTNTWKLSFLEIHSEGSNKTYYQHTISYIFMSLIIPLLKK